MGEVSDISWTDATHNEWIGCTKVSPGCANCYAETLWGRCAKIPHVHAAHGPQATTGVRAEGVCPQHELEPAAARELERSGYARFLPLDLRPRDQLAEDRRLVARLCALDSGLSDWEVSFVDSLSKRVEGGLTLTDRQRERALQIDER